MPREPSDHVFAMPMDGDSSLSQSQSSPVSLYPLRVVHIVMVTYLRKKSLIFFFSLNIKVHTRANLVYVTGVA
jgi:hypothetical protein